MSQTPADTFTAFSAILARMSMPRGTPPSAPSLGEPVIDVPEVDPRFATQALSHYGAGAAVWWHNSNELLATLMWEPPVTNGGSQILQYQVEYRSRIRTDFLTPTERRLNEFVVKQVHSSNKAAPSEQPERGFQEMLTVDGHTTAVQIPHLIPYMRYDFRVKAANMNGYGTPSAVVTIDAMCITPPVQLEELEVGERTVSVSWRQPVLPRMSRGSAIVLEHYELHYREIGQEQWQVQTMPPTPTNFEITNLCPNTQHELRLCAAYSTGIGPPSKPHFFTTEYNARGPPRPLVVKAGYVQGSLVVTWELLPDFKAAHYELQMTELLDETRLEGPQSVTFSARSNCYVVKGLPEGSRHEICVRARTSDGFASMWTEPLQIIIAPGEVFETEEMDPMPDVQMSGEDLLDHHESDDEPDAIQQDTMTRPDELQDSTAVEVESRDLDQSDYGIDVYTAQPAAVVVAVEGPELAAALESTVADEGPAAAEAKSELEPSADPSADPAEAEPEPVVVGEAGAAAPPQETVLAGSVQNNEPRQEPESGKEQEPENEPGQESARDLEPEPEPESQQEQGQGQEPESQREQGQEQEPESAREQEPEQEPESAREQGQEQEPESAREQGQEQEPEEQEAVATNEAPEPPLEKAPETESAEAADAEV